MKYLKGFLWMVFLLIGTSVNGQITLNACNPLLENQDYTFNQISTDGTGRNVFETNPVTGDQDCDGIGVCEMQVAWNNGNNRWEIYADDGDGTFTNTFVLYYNMEASTPNPPSLTLGTWEENTAVTASLCIDGIITLTGDVQDTTLEVPDESLGQIRLFPNPASGMVHVLSNHSIIDAVTLSDINGRIIINKTEGFKRISVSKLSSGMYFVGIQVREKLEVRKLIVK